MAENRLCKEFDHSHTGIEIPKVRSKMKSRKHFLDSG